VKGFLLGSITIYHLQPPLSLNIYPRKEMEVDFTSSANSDRLIVGPSEISVGKDSEAVSSREECLDWVALCTMVAARVRHGHMLAIIPVGL